MSRLTPMIFIIAFTSVTGIFIVALLTMKLSEPMHFYGAVAAGAVVATFVSIIIAKQISD